MAFGASVDKMKSLAAIAMKEHTQPFLPGTFQEEGQSNSDRVQLLKDFSFLDFVSAPGHKVVRDPVIVMAIANQIREGLLDVSTWTSSMEANIQLNVHLNSDTGQVCNVQVFNGNHRMAGLILSGQYKTIQALIGNYGMDVVEKMFTVMVNNVLPYPWILSSTWGDHFGENRGQWTGEYFPRPFDYYTCDFHDCYNAWYGISESIPVPTNTIYENINVIPSGEVKETNMMEVIIDPYEKLVEMNDRNRKNLPRRRYRTWNVPSSVWDKGYENCPDDWYPFIERGAINGKWIDEERRIPEIGFDVEFPASFTGLSPCLQDVAGVPLAELVIASFEKGTSVNQSHAMTPEESAPETPRNACSRTHQSLDEFLNCVSDRLIRLEPMTRF